MKYLNTVPGLTCLAFVFVMSLSVISGLAQAPTQPDTFSGKYEGTAKSEDGSFINVTLDLKRDGTKITGTATSGATTLKVTEGSLTDNKLVLKFENHDGTLTAKVESEKISGDWTEGPRKRVIDLKKVVPLAAPVGATPVVAPFSLTGEWDAVADANGQPFPFLLVLKVDGEKLSGSSSSQLGESNITNGVWKDGRLNFQLEGANGTITMSATVMDGKLTGEFDYSGQLQGKWVAVKKK